MKNKYFFILLSLFLLTSTISSFACTFSRPTSRPSTITTPAATPATTVPPAVPVPVIQASVTPTTTTPGGPASLNWNVTNATSLVIDQGIGAVPLSGSRQVFPDVTTTYIFTAYFPAGTVMNSVTLAVSPTGASPPAPTGDKDWVGSTYTKEYHFPGCSIAMRITPPHKIWFASWQQALDSGYHPCPVCKPPRQ